jgi:hypothetical protein
MFEQYLLKTAMSEVNPKPSTDVLGCWKIADNMLSSFLLFFRARISIMKASAYPEI